MHLARSQHLVAENQHERLQRAPRQPIYRETVALKNMHSEVELVIRVFPRRRQP
jgi:hypothetical protein